MKKLLPLLFILILTAGCVQLEAPEATYVDARVTDVTLEGAEVEFLFKVKNKNPIDLEVSEYSYKIFINDKELLSEKRGGFVIPAGKTKDILIPVMLRYDRVFDTWLAIGANILAGKMYFDYRLEGSISAGAMGMTVSTPFSASGRINITEEHLGQ